jgi:hypothetical protein
MEIHLRKKNIITTTTMMTKQGKIAIITIIIMKKGMKQNTIIITMMILLKDNASTTIMTSGTLMLTVDHAHVTQDGMTAVMVKDATAVMASVWNRKVAEAGQSESTHVLLTVTVALNEAIALKIHQRRISNMANAVILQMMLLGAVLDLTKRRAGVDKDITTIMANLNHVTRNLNGKISNQ